MRSTVVTIVGRPNVGKSALFNRIVGKRTAIVEEYSGITRDRLYSTFEYEEEHFTIVDTGGIEGTGKNELKRKVQEQTNFAISEADIIFFVVDGNDGVMPFDEEIANKLHKIQAPVFLIINKIDNEKRKSFIYEFHKLGFKFQFHISAIHNLNMSTLLEKTVETARDLRTRETKVNFCDYPEDIVKLCIVGCPNVGKSSLVNSLIGEERSIVNDSPGTTRDAIDSTLKYYGMDIVLIDTAGLRKKSKISEKIERYSVIRTLKAIDRSDIVIFMIDSNKGVTIGDTKIASYIYEAGRGVVVVFNKWDQIEKDDKTYLKFQEQVDSKLYFLNNPPVEFISALDQTRIHKILESAMKVYDCYRIEIQTSKLNKIIEKAQADTPGERKGSQVFKIFYGTQTGRKPPIVKLFVNNPDICKPNYKRYLTKRIIKEVGLFGVPLKIYLKSRR
ncbi:ribosome biogenesis GTPase Der [Candidatus Dependentiae bacterium]|nr:ribosome biogenesis GTPase Der [Candidatus Dependentiae bacterium]